jgi:hypothetical protein
LKGAAWSPLKLPSCPGLVRPITAPLPFKCPTDEETPAEARERMRRKQFKSVPFGGCLTVYAIHGCLDVDDVRDALAPLLAEHRDIADALHQLDAAEALAVLGIAIEVVIEIPIYLLGGIFDANGKDRCAGGNGFSRLLALCTGFIDSDPRENCKREKCRHHKTPSYGARRTRELLAESPYWFVRECRMHPGEVDEEATEAKAREWRRKKLRGTPPTVYKKWFTSPTTGETMAHPYIRSPIYFPNEARHELLGTGVKATRDQGRGSRLLWKLVRVLQQEQTRRTITGQSLRRWHAYAAPLRKVLRGIGLGKYHQVVAWNRTERLYADAQGITLKPFRDPRVLWTKVDRQKAWESKFDRLPDYSTGLLPPLHTRKVFLELRDFFLARNRQCISKPLEIEVQKAGMITPGSATPRRRTSKGKSARARLHATSPSDRDPPARESAAGREVSPAPVTTSWRDVRINQERRTSKGSSPITSDARAKDRPP